MLQSEHISVFARGVYIRIDTRCTLETQASNLPRVLVIGGGFAGIEIARRLKNVPATVIIVDRRNYHLFQPLLYQVATATLSPADIAAPIRGILRGIENCRVVLAKARGVNLVKKRVAFDKVEAEYDWLVLAAGATHSYFGRDDWATLAPGLKTIEDATDIRRRILLAFENAEYEGSDERRRAALTFAIIGGGPTGVELAGSIQEIAAETIPEDFRMIDTKTTRVLLFQGGDRLIPDFPPELSERARKDLEGLGVEVRLNTRVTDITTEGIYIGKEFLPVKNVLWAAGVKASPLAETLGVPLDKSGRVIVGPDLAVPENPNVFVVGDMAAAVSASNGTPVPGVAQAAIQMGRYVGDIIAKEIAAGKFSKRVPFSYRDKGAMATIGKTHAVGTVFGLKVAGFFAWLIWGAVHILSLIGFRNRFAVLISWFGYWLFNSRDARLITGEASLSIKKQRPGERVFETETQNEDKTPPDAKASGERI